MRGAGGAVRVASWSDNGAMPVILHVMTALPAGHASAVVQSAFQIQGRGWVLELRELAGQIRTGEWISGLYALNQKRLKVRAVEYLDRGLDSGAPRASVAVVVPELDESLARDLVSKPICFFQSSLLSLEARIL